MKLFISMMMIALSLSAFGKGGEGSGTRGGGDPRLAAWPQPFHAEDLQRYVSYYVKHLDSRIEYLVPQTDEDKRALERLRSMTRTGALLNDVSFLCTRYIPRPNGSIQIEGQGRVRAATEYNRPCAPIEYEELVLSEAPSYVISLMIHEHSRHFSTPGSSESDDDQAILEFVKKDVESNLPKWKLDEKRAYILRAFFYQRAILDIGHRFKGIERVVLVRDLASHLLLLPATTWVDAELEERQPKRVSKWQSDLVAYRKQLQSLIDRGDIDLARQYLKPIAISLATYGPELDLEDLGPESYEIMEMPYPTGNLYVVFNRVLFVKAFKSRMSAEAFVASKPGPDSFSFSPF